MSARECTCVICELHRAIARRLGAPFCEPRPADATHPRGLSGQHTRAEIEAEIQRRRDAAAAQRVH